MEKIMLDKEAYVQAVAEYRSRYGYEDMSQDEKIEFDQKLDKVVVVGEADSSFNNCETVTAFSAALNAGLFFGNAFSFHILLPPNPKGGKSRLFHQISTGIIPYPLPCYNYRTVTTSPGKIRKSIYFFAPEMYDKNSMLSRRKSHEQRKTSGSLHQNFLDLYHLHAVERHASGHRADSGQAV